MSAFARLPLGTVAAVTTVHGRSTWHKITTWRATTTIAAWSAWATTWSAAIGAGKTVCAALWRAKLWLLAITLALKLAVSLTITTCWAASAAIAVSAAAAARAACGLVALGFADALHHVATCSLGGCGHHVTAGRATSAAPQGLTAHGDGLSLFTRFWAKAFNGVHLNFLLGEALDFLHETFFNRKSVV